jgi:hypothetical protein
MCELSELSELCELCELSPQDAVESLSVKGVMGGVGLFFGRDAGIRPAYLVRVQPVQLFVKFDIFGSFFEVWRLSGAVVPDKSFVSRR